MARKNKAAKASSQALAPSPETISRRGWKVIGGGASLVVLGFAVLTRADPFGRNWAASLCPFLILGGYALMGLGIFVPEKAAEAASSAASPSPVFSQKRA